MRPRNRYLLPLLAVALFAAFPLLFVCCTPTWFPDSETYVDVNPAGQVMLCNLRTKTRRILTTSNNSPMAKVAVRSDGKGIVLGRTIPLSKPPKLQVVAYDLDGNETHKSTEIEIPQAGTAPLGVTQTYLSPDNRYSVSFVVAATQSAIIYDFKEKTFKRLEFI